MYEEKKMHDSAQYFGTCLPEILGRIMQILWSNRGFFFNLFNLMKMAFNFIHLFSEKNLNRHVSPSVSNLIKLRGLPKVPVTKNSSKVRLWNWNPYITYSSNQHFMWSFSIRGHVQTTWTYEGEGVAQMP